MALNKILVKNFQSIPDAEVEIGSFTVFTGPSSSGKSAFMRAAEALARNNFTPAQVRQGEKTTTVSIEFDDHTISAERGKSKSTYTLDDEKFTKAGRAVPDQVRDALLMPLISDTESNFATQFDKPYLIAEPGATASAVLGSLTNVSVLHAGIKEANRRNLAVNSRVRAEEERVESIEDSLTKYAGLDDILGSLSVTRNYLDELIPRSHRVEELETLLTQISEQVQLLFVARAKQVDVAPLVEQVSTLSSKVAAVNELTTIVNRITKLKASMPTNIYAGIDEVTTDALTGRVAEAGALADHLARIASTVQALQASRKKSAEFTTEVTGLEAQSARMLEEMGTCYVCGQSTKGVMHDNGC